MVEADVPPLAETRELPHGAPSIVRILIETPVIRLPPGFKWDNTELPAGGNWVILIGVGVGITCLVLTHLGARAFLSWYRERRAPEFPLAT